MYRVKSLKENSKYTNSLKNLFEVIDNHNMDSSEVNYLHRLAAMLLGSTFEEDAKQAFVSYKEINFYETLNELIQSKGLPADWAFTIFNLFHPIHYYLVSKQKYKIAGLLRNFIFKNYAYNLRDAKWVAFMANFFASLHYDYSPNNKELESIRNIGKYVFAKFDTGEANLEETPEIRIYICFVGLMMADMEMQTPVEGSREQCAFLFEEVNLDKRINSTCLYELWQFLHNFKQMIEKDSTFSVINLTHCYVLDSVCREKWTTAIFANRCFEMSKSYSSPLAKQWITRVNYTEILLRGGAYSV